MADEVGKETEEFVLELLTREVEDPANVVFLSAQMQATGLRPHFDEMQKRVTTRELDSEQVVRTVYRDQLIQEVRDELASKRPTVKGQPPVPSPLVEEVITSPHMEVGNGSVDHNAPTAAALTPSVIERLSSWAIEHEALVQGATLDEVEVDEGTRQRLGETVQANQVETGRSFYKTAPDSKEAGTPAPPLSEGVTLTPTVIVAVPPWLVVVICVVMLLTFIAGGIVAKLMF